MKMALSARAKLNSEQISVLLKYGYEIKTFSDFPRERFDVYLGYPEPLMLKERYLGASLIHLLSAGYDKLDIKDIREKGIILTNSKGVYDTPIAEYVLYCILDYCKKGSYFFSQQKKHVWRREFPCCEISMLKIGILGTGSIATACAQRLCQLGAQVIGLNRTGKQASYFKMVYSMEQISVFLREPDVIVNTLPLNSDTKGLLDYERLSCIKNDAALICVGRGKTLVEEDLKKLLQKKDITAYLDVFEKEPLEKDCWMYNCEKIHITPHISFASNAAYRRMSELAYENAKRFIKGDSLINVVERC